MENVSYGATICAEQAAVASAVADGQMAFEAIAVVADSPSACTPCGKCRQVLTEFRSDLVVICANVAGVRHVTSVAALLPGAFERGQLPVSSGHLYTGGSEG